MDRPQFLYRIIEWLRDGYPDGVPHGDYIPLVALLRRQLTDDEVTQVSAGLIRKSPRTPEAISKIDAAIAITKVTHELPHEDDIARVRRHLECSGWPFDDSLPQARTEHGTRTLLPLPLPAGPAALSRRDELLAIIEGSASFVPVSENAPETASLTGALGLGRPIDGSISLVVSTSGTTGTPKGAQHTPSTLTASARATEARLGGPGSWLLALPPHHIAGLQVLLRALRSGYEPTVLDLSDGFVPEAFADALDNLDGPRRYTSLVPTQLHKVLDSPRATAVLAAADGLLVGGAATPDSLLQRAIEAGLPIIRTYGMSETAGGCVYDGVPLDGVRIAIDEPDADGIGRVLIGGSVVAHGYRNLPGHPAFTDPGWFRTDDLGRLDSDGVLTIIGRADEAITTGGLTVVPQVVEAVILDDPAVADCAVVGLPDERLGEKVVVFVTPSGVTAVDAGRIRGAVTERLGRYAAPREVIEVSDLPRRGPGKVDRLALRARFAS